MSNLTLAFFWALWLLTAFGTLLGYREFVGGVFGQYATPTARYVLFWVALIAVALGVLGGSIYLKNHGQHRAALWLAGGPLLLASPYILFLLVAMLGGKNMRWN